MWQELDRTNNINDSYVIRYNVYKQTMLEVFGAVQFFLQVSSVAISSKLEDQVDTVSVQV